MGDLYELLKGRLQGVKKIAVLGVGSVLRADDAAGVFIVEKLKNVFDPAEYPDIRFYNGETAPENFSGEIKNFCPSHLLVIDAADAGEQPGSIMHIDPKDIGGLTFCTHMMPLKIMIDYLQKETGTAVTLIGIQYKDITFDGGVTPEIQEAIDEVYETIKRIINEIVHI